MVVGVAGSVLVAFAIVRDRGPVGDVVQTITSVLAVTGAIVLWLWTRSRRDVPTSLDAFALASDALAAAVSAQWKHAAGERRLRHPTPIPVRWRWSHWEVTGEAIEAVGSVGQARFAPLPGMAAATLATVGAGGIRDLFGVYGGLDSGRVIVLGGAGTGKSAAAILTVLDALNHRQGLADAQRAQVPVPVLLTAHGWDPRHQRLGEWLAARLDDGYPFLRSESYGRDAAARLVESGRVALVLDGFDEIAEDLRPVALRALDQQVTFRLMVLTRTPELVDAVVGGHLHGAAALELLSVPAQEAADYLIRCQVQPPLPAWQRLAEHLRVAPDSAVSTALGTPLMLTLVRDTFSAPAEVDDLLTPGRFTSQAEVEGYLLGRALPAAYRSRPGQLPAPYSLEQATRWLGYLATEMNHRNTRDLAWWHIRQWAPAPIRIVTMALPSALGLGSSIGPVFGLVFGVTTGIVVGLATGLANGVAIGLTVGLREGHRYAPVRRPRKRVWKPSFPQGNLAAGLAGGLASGLAAGIASVITVGLARGLAAGVVFGLAVALTFGLASGTTEGLLEGRRNAGPRQLKQFRWRTVVSRGNLAVGLAFGLIFGLAVGLTFGLTGGPTAGFTGGLAVGLAGGLVFMVVNGFVQASADVTSPMDPVTCWHRDRRSGFAEGLAYGLAGALAFGPAAGFVGGIGTGLTLGLLNGLGVGIAFTFAVSQAWLVTLGFIFLSCAGLLPRRGLHFLEDARERGVLRTVGSVYQFRHARLQDQLANSPLPTHGT